MKRHASALLVVSQVFVAAAAWAHPGHGSGGNSLLHYLSEPVHVAFGVLLAAGIGLGARALRRARTTTLRLR